MPQSKATERDGAGETIEFTSFPPQLTDQANKDTIDDKMVLELLGQFLLTASQSHRAFLQQQEDSVRDLMKRIPDNPQFVEAELAKVYQQVRVSFSRLVEAIGDHPVALPWELIAVNPTLVTA